MKDHLTAVAALRIGLSALMIFIALIVFVFVVGAGLISGDVEAMAITTFVGIAVAFFLGLLSIPGIVGGIGLLKQKPWARILVMVLAVFDLFNVPLGTVVGIYTFWVLMQDETAAMFEAAE